MSDYSDITKVYEEAIHTYALDADNEIKAAGRMGEYLLFRASFRSSKDNLVRLIYWRVKRLADRAKYRGGNSLAGDIAQARTELAEEIDRAT